MNEKLSGVSSVQLAESQQHLIPVTAKMVQTKRSLQNKKSSATKKCETKAVSITTKPECGLPNQLLPPDSRAASLIRLQQHHTRLQDVRLAVYQHFDCDEHLHRISINFEPNIMILIWFSDADFLLCLRTYTEPGNDIIVTASSAPQQAGSVPKCSTKFLRNAEKNVLAHLPLHYFLEKEDVLLWIIFYSHFFIGSS